MKKITIKTASDIALIKYWGKKDEVLRLPENGSVSIKLDGLDTVTTVEFREDLSKDHITIQGESDNKETARVVKHLDRIRKQFGKDVYAKVVSQNTFPKGTGLSSSGSGFAALTFAATKSLEMNLSEKELSILSRQGSGTACRCACGGFVEWLDGDTSETSYSHSIQSPDFWDVRDVVVVVDEGKKKISSTEGHTLAQSSPFYSERQKRIKGKIEEIKGYIENKEFDKMGMLAEKEALEFHTILLTSETPMIAWYPGTVEVMQEVVRLREEGISCYFTINTGFNVHVLTLPEYEKQVQERMMALSSVQKVLLAKVGDKPQEVNEHLF
ncbi:MAG: diphosphomevalonate decarboxylase [Candidatus Pacebacteria bacterium]|nr:diphosphomevalonate decarboxylase [Candidatus Paceibacterota bacterium]